MTAGGFVLPNLILAGAPKSGTSSVHEWLGAHPRALGSVPKETAYFVDPGSHIHDPARHIANGLDAYRTFFPARAGEADVVFESTPAYLYQSCALDHVPNLPTRPRVLFILREPAAQIRSVHAYYRNNWDWIPAGMDFAAFCRVLHQGTHAFGGNELCRDALANARYCEPLMAWRDRLGPERMKVMLFEDLARDPRAFMQGLCRWLAIDPAFYDAYVFARMNETYAVRSRLLHKAVIRLRPMAERATWLRNGLRRGYRRLNTGSATPPNEADRDALRQLRHEFEPANQRLSEAFGLDLSAWRNAAGS